MSATSQAAPRRSIAAEMQLRRSEEAATSPTAIQRDIDFAYGVGSSNDALQAYLALPRDVLQQLGSIALALDQ